MEKILLVEDDASLTPLYLKVLAQAGYEVIVAHDGKAALTLLTKAAPAAIILDIMLPGGMNGFDVLEKIKSDVNLNKIPVLVLTNLDTEQKVAKDIGAEAYIVKIDLNIHDLPEQIRKLIAQAR